MTSSMLGKLWPGKLSTWARPGWWQTMEQVGLAAVEQAERNRRISEVEQRALTLDHVEMGWSGRRAEQFGGARNEIDDHRVDRDSRPENHDPGLAGGAEDDVVPARDEAASDRQRNIFLA